MSGRAWMLAALLLVACKTERSQAGAEAKPELRVSELPRDPAGVEAWNRARAAGETDAITLEQLDRSGADLTGRP